MEDNLYPYGSDNNQSNSGTNAPYSQMMQGQNSAEYQGYSAADEGEQKSKPGFGAGLGVGLGIGAVALIFMLIVMSLGGANKSVKTKQDDVLNDEAIEKIGTLQEVIDKYYFDYKDDEITRDEMRDGIYHGLVDSLNDQYAAYLNEEELKAMFEDNQGIYYGIGAYISLGDTGYPLFSGIMEGTPAEEAGLHAGDVIYKVNDESAYGMSLDDVVSRVKGDEGTTVHLTLYREGENDYLEFDVARRKVETPTVKHEMLDDGIGYLQIKEFDIVTVKQFEEAYQDIRSQGAKGLILDLRSNPGGMLDAVTDIARQILPEGLIVYELDNQGNRNDYTCDGKNEIDIPLVVLVNDYSASASEILAGAIRDYEIGTLVGTTTYGKGIVQTMRPFPDGTAIKITTSAYYSPKGINIQGKGIEPDIEIEFDADAYYDDGIDNQLEKAKELLK